MMFNILEIRNYLLKPHMLEHFFDYFEQHFIASQEAEHMQILGQFRLQGEPDRFVWMRGFKDMETRLKGLQNFYGGAVWKKYGSVANSMMLEVDNVHLLRPLDDSDLLRGYSAERIAAEMNAGTISPVNGIIAVDFYTAAPGERDTLIEQFRAKVEPLYQAEGVQVLGTFVAEMRPNDFPALPVIQDENELVVITAYESEQACREKRAQIENAMSTSQTWLLGPTLRSPLRYVPE